MIVFRADPISIYKICAHTGVAGNTENDKLAGLEHNLIWVWNPDNIYADVGITGRVANWIQYATDDTGHLSNLRLP